MISRHWAIAIVVAGLALAPACRVWASCESILIIQSPRLEFWYNDATSMSRESETDTIPRSHYGGLARGLATAFKIWQATGGDSGTTGDKSRPRLDLRLQAGSTLARSYQRGEDGWAPRDSSVMARFAGTDTDSSVELWTCELACFRDHTRALKLAARIPWTIVPESLFTTFDRSAHVRWFHEDCSRTLEVSGFIAPAPQCERVCCGLFFSKADAKQRANLLAQQLVLRPIVTRVRVDGALLEQILGVNAPVPPEEP